MRAFVFIYTQWWACENVYIDYLGIIFICVMSSKLPMISLVEVELEYPT